MSGAGPSLHVLAATAARRLRRMSTALALLLAVAAASVVAAFVPQERTHAVTLAHWRAGVDGPGVRVTGILDAAGITDVFGSWWFLVLAGALLTSLLACLVPRWREFARAARRPPPRGRHLDRLALHATVDTDLPGPAALAAARGVLARRRWRTRVIGASGAAHAQVAAQRAWWREGASLVFHSMLPVLVLAALAGPAFGFTGQVDVVEGEAFADTAVAYDRARPGRWWATGDHRGFTVALEHFRTSVHPSGVPEEFTAVVAVTPRAGPTRRAEVEINRPLREAGMRVHLARHGLAPHLEVRDRDGDLVFAGHARLDETRTGGWVGFVALAGGGDAAVLDLVLVPDAAVDRHGGLRAVGGGTTAVLLADVYRSAGGGADLDRSAGPLGATAVVPLGGEAALDGTGWRVTLTAVDRWTGFQVTRAPGSWVLLAAALTALAGLTVSLRACPRRLWVEARPRPGGGTRLVVAGAARGRPWAFAEAFPGLVARLESAAAPPPGAAVPPGRGQPERSPVATPG